VSGSLTAPNRAILAGMRDGREASGSPLDGQKLELEYPCSWSYTVFGADTNLLERAVREVVGDAAHTLRASQKSKGGKYFSMHLAVTVQDDEQRLTIFRELHEHSDVVYVL